MCWQTKALVDSVEGVLSAAAAVGSPAGAYGARQSRRSRYHRRSLPIPRR